MSLTLILTVVVVLGGLAYFYIKQQQKPPSHEDISQYFDKANEHLESHKSALVNAAVAADQHIDAKKSEIAGLSAAIGDANNSLDTAQHYRNTAASMLAQFQQQPG